MDRALQPTRPTADPASEWPLAVEAGDSSRVASLLASGAGVDATFDKGETALMRASARGYADVARVLLAAGANVNARRDDGFTPLMLAVFFGNEELVRLLLEAGADASARTALGTTAAKWAASRGFKEIAELLKEAEASRPAPTPEPDEPRRAETEEVRPVATSSFELRGLPFEPPDSPPERRAATAEPQVPKARTAEHEDLKARMEALFASSPTGAAREPDAATKADIREGASFINNRAGEGATVERPRTEDVPASTPFAPDESASKTAPKGSAASSGSRFRSVLQSWPVTAGAVVLIVGSVASVFLLGRSSGISDTRPAPTGEAAQPVVPQTPPQAAENLPQPSPSVTPELAQPLPVAPGTYDSFPFTTSPPQEVTVSSGPTPAAGGAPASNVPSVVSESGGGTPEGEAPRGRAGDAETRDASKLPAAASRAAREGEGIDEGAAPVAPPQNPQRTGVETRRTAAGAQSPSSVNPPPPAPTPAERRKVIQWP